MNRSQQRQSNYELIWNIVKQIPKGKVTTYGEVAQFCNLPNQARLVGYALHKLPSKTKIPWHRVINSQGKISFPCKSKNYNKQKKLLTAEGVKFIYEEIDLDKFGWLRNL